MKTLDITAKEWFSKTYGNSYFAAVITIDYGLPTAKEIRLPFQYGYGDHYLEMAKEKLIALKIIPETTAPIYRYCRENNIIFRNHKHTDCKQRDVKLFGL